MKLSRFHKILAASGVSLGLFLGGASMTLAATDVAVLDDLVFSKETFVVGDTVRVYASLRNTGDTDVTGNLYFYIGAQQVGKAHEISIPKGGQKEEVFADFVVPADGFNIRAVISDVSPSDTNLTNNEVLSSIFEPVADADGDGVPDKGDNCPFVKNADQRDLDRDGQGNVCDDDIDGDGLSNTEEQQKGTDPLNADTDGDGVSDKNDPTPLGEPLTVPKVPVVEPIKPLVPVVTSTSTESVAPVVTSTPVETTSVTSSEEGLVESPPVAEGSLAEASTPEFSENALFTFEETRWGTYRFRVVAPTNDEGYRYLWMFGDDTTSSRKDVTHYYGQTGAFTVTLRVTAPDGGVAEDTIDVHIPFFDFQNRSVRMLVIFLSMMILVGISLFARLGKQEEVVVPKKRSRRSS